MWTSLDSEKGKCQTRLEDLKTVMRLIYKVSKVSATSTYVLYTFTGSLQRSLLKVLFLRNTYCYMFLPVPGGESCGAGTLHRWSCCRGKFWKKRHRLFRSGHSDTPLHPAWGHEGPPWVQLQPVWWGPADSYTWHCEFYNYVIDTQREEFPC